MYRVLVVMTLEYDLRRLRSLPVWDEYSGFELSSVAHDGQHALKLLREEHYDMVITEINLIYLDGLQLQRYIYEESLCPVVVILSDDTGFQAVRECIMYGAFDYMQKMPSKEILLEMFGRAQEYLLQHSQKSVEQANNLYAGIEEFRADEDAVVKAIFNHDRRGIDIFRATAKLLYQLNQEYSVKADVQIRQLFRNIVNRIFEQMSWLHLYTQAESYRRLDTLFVDRQVRAEDSYAEKLKQLLNRIDNLCPYTGDQIIQEIILYVLSHPEEELQLKHLASERYINYSYLSTTFSSQAGISFSEFVTKARIERAAYLLLHTDLRVGEICARLTYKDYDYFSRLFKRIYHLSPKAFRKANEPSVDYSFL